MQSITSLGLFAVVQFLLVLMVGALPLVAGVQSHSRLLYRMTAIAAGFLIGAAFLIVVPEGFELYGHQASEHTDSLISPAMTAGLAVLSGFLFILLLEGLGFGHDLHEEHHDHAREHGHEHLNHPAGSARNVVIGLSLHSLTDGVALGAAYALGEVALSVQLALVIMMHRFPAALSLAAYSLHERNDPRRSMVDLVLFSLTTPLAMLVSSQIFADVDQSTIGLMLLFAAGSFIYVATVDVLPAIHIQEKSRETLWLVLSGILAMVLVSFLVVLLLPGVAH